MARGQRRYGKARGRDPNRSHKPSMRSDSRRDRDRGNRNDRRGGVLN